MKRALKLIPQRCQNICSLEQVRNVISQAEEPLIMELIAALRARSAELNPDWELITVCVPKYDFEQRRKTVEFIFSMFDEEERKAKEENLSQ